MPETDNNLDQTLGSATDQDTTPATAEPTPERVFNGYDLYQLQMHHAPVWKRGNKFYVVDWFDNKEYEHSTEGYTPAQMQILERVAITDAKPQQAPASNAPATIGQRRK